MFQYILHGWYILTIVLVACIVGYLAYYLLERISAKRRKSKAEANMNEGDDNIVMEEIFIDETGENAIIVHEEVTISKKNVADLIADDREEMTDEYEQDDEIIVAGTIVTETTEEDVPSMKKHKVKNIAEGVSRQDILQDKHDKSLQKLKYEAAISKQRNDMASYEKKLIEGLILDPDDVDIFRQLADFYFSEGKYAKALSMFRKILTFDPNDHHALRQTGEIYIEQGHYEDAQVFIEKALSLSPDNPKYYISLIDICIAKEEFETAMGYLEKIVALRPRNISYLMALGEMYEKLGRPEDAKQTYFRVLEIDPLHTDVKHILKKF